MSCNDQVCVYVTHTLLPHKGSCFSRDVRARYTCKVDKAMQNDVKQFMQLRKDNSEPFNTVQNFNAASYHATSSTSSWRVFRERRLHQLLPYANDTDIIGRSKRDVTAAFSYIATEIGLAVNEGKTKYMLLRSIGLRPIGSQLTADNYSFDTVKELIYLSSVVNSRIDVSLEIKCRITLVINFYCSLNKTRVSWRLFPHPIQQ